MLNDRESRSSMRGTPEENRRDERTIHKCVPATVHESIDENHANTDHSMESIGHAGWQYTTGINIHRIHLLLHDLR